MIPVSPTRADIEGRLKAATGGHWSAVYSPRAAARASCARSSTRCRGTQAESVDEIVSDNGTHVVCFGHDYDDYGSMRVPDVELIANAPADLRFLLDELARVEATNGALVDHNAVLMAQIARFEDMARRVTEWQEAHHRSVAAYEAMALHEDDPDKDGRAAYWRASEALAEITKALLALQTETHDGK